jgi:hypothetical protein
VTGLTYKSVARRSRAGHGYLGGRSPASDARLVEAFRKGLANWALSRPQRIDRIPLGQQPARTARGVGHGSGSPRAARHRDDRRHQERGGGETGDRGHTDRVHHRRRPGEDRARRKPRAAGRQRHSLAIVFDELHDKRFDLLRELAPAAEVIGLLVNPANPVAESALAHVRALARDRRNLVVATASNEGELAAAFAKLRAQRVSALLIGSDSFFEPHHRGIVNLVAGLKVPAIYHLREFVSAGGLASYGTSRMSLTAWPEPMSPGF